MLLDGRSKQYQQFENLKKGHGSRGTDVCDVEIGHGFEEWTSTRGWMLI
jgi:hypothetical protein